MIWNEYGLEGGISQLAVAVGGTDGLARPARRGASADSLQPGDAQPERFCAGRDWDCASDSDHVCDGDVSGARTGTRVTGAVDGEPAVAVGADAGEINSLSDHWHVDGDQFVLNHAMAFS